MRTCHAIAEILSLMQVEVVTRKMIRTEAGRGRIPDILTRFPWKVAIEVQTSWISPKIIFERIADHNELGYSSLWFLSSEELGDSSVNYDLMYGACSNGQVFWFLEEKHRKLSLEKGMLVFDAEFENWEVDESGSFYKENIIVESTWNDLEFNLDGFCRHKNKPKCTSLEERKFEKKRDIDKLYRECIADYKKAPDTKYGIFIKKAYKNIWGKIRKEELISERQLILIMREPKRMCKDFPSIDKYMYLTY
jgi:hypothetical protein